MDDNQQITNAEQQPQQQPQDPQPQLASTKTLLIIAALLAAAFIVFGGFFFVMNNFRTNTTPQHQPAQSVTTLPTQATAVDLPTGVPSPTNPSNSKRKNDLLQIQEGIYKYKTAKGSLPPQITTTDQAIAKEGADLCTALVPTYIPSLPKDPLSEEDMNAPIGSIKDCTTQYITGYVIVKSEEGIVTIRAPFAQEETIVVKF